MKGPEYDPIVMSPALWLRHRWYYWRSGRGVFKSELRYEKMTEAPAVLKVVVRIWRWSSGWGAEVRVGAFHWLLVPKGSRNRPPMEGEREGSPAIAVPLKHARPAEGK